MTTVDANGYLGRFGIVARGVAETGDFLRELDRYEIERALVSSTTAILHDVARGNAMNFEACAASGGRLLPVAVVNPRWGVDCAAEILHSGVHAIRVCPSLQLFSLNNEPLLADTLAWCREHGMVVMVDMGLQCCTGAYAPAPVAEAQDFCARHPEVRILLQGYPFMLAPATDRFLRDHSHVAVETSSLFGGLALEHLVAEGLEGQIWLGTGFGLNSLALAETVRRAAIPAAVQEKILSGNALQALGL